MQQQRAQRAKIFEEQTNQALAYTVAAGGQCLTPNDIWQGVNWKHCQPNYRQVVAMLFTLRDQQRGACTRLSGNTHVWWFEEPASSGDDHKSSSSDGQVIPPVPPAAAAPPAPWAPQVPWMLSASAV